MDSIDKQKRQSISKKIETLKAMNEIHPNSRDREWWDHIESAIKQLLVLCQEQDVKLPIFGWFMIPELEKILKQFDGLHEMERPKTRKWKIKTSIDGFAYDYLKKTEQFGKLKK